jgi:Domain of unknown function (DUF4276)
MVKEIRIYWEGGKTKDLLRKGMNGFLQGLRNTARSNRISWNLIACGSRDSAYKDFVMALNTFPDAFNVLLVDSDSLVALPPWRHLRQNNGWEIAEEYDPQCHLMAQAMEAWLIADVEALRKYYGLDFNANSIPGNANVEQIDKNQLARALDDATRKTQKGKYHKIKHACEILQKLDVAKVRKAAFHCERLFKTLEEKMDANNQEDRQ